jgi:hypothetical protein
MMKLEEQFKWFLANQEELLKTHNGKVLVIKGQRVIGVYDDEATAILEAQKEHELGTFLVQRCTPGRESYTLEYHSRVVFA